jgi:hypothetical protein
VRRSRERKITGFFHRFDNIRVVMAPQLKFAEMRQEFCYRTPPSPDTDSGIDARNRHGCREGQE